MYLGGVHDAYGYFLGQGLSVVGVHVLWFVFSGVVFIFVYLCGSVGLWGVRGLCG